MPSITESKRRLAVLNAMRNLSDVATNLNTLTDLVVYLVALINSDDNEDIISCACGILSNLTCNNVPNKQAVYVSRGIPILANVLDRFRVFEDITEPALCTLRFVLFQFYAANFLPFVSFFCKKKFIIYYFKLLNDWK